MSTSTDATRSCHTCPNFLNVVEAAHMFGKSTAAPMCALLGYLLARPGASNDENTATAEAYAAECPSYGTPRATTPPPRPRTEVVLADPKFRTELDELAPPRTIVSSCAQCKNFVEDDVVQKALGWAGGICRAKGRLIPGNRRAIEANGCQFRQMGARSGDTDNLQLLPYYVAVERKVAARIAKGITRTEPLEYPSDRDVTPDEADLGIIAWRRLTDPEDEDQSVMLPIFDPKSFTQEERELIPQTGSDEHPELYLDHNGALFQIACLWMEMDETPSVWGQPGVGKTEVGRHLAWLMQVPFYRFSIKESTELYELEGAKEFDPDKGSWFRDGRFTVAWRSRCVIVVDEPNMGRPEIWAFLRPCMDNSRQLILDSDAGRHVQRNAFCFLMLAMNPAWSPLNIGTNPIGLADASRLMHVDFGLPDAPIEREIIRNRVIIDGWIIDDARLDLVMAVSEMVRELCENGTLALSWGIRESIKTARALRFFDPIRAFRMAAADYLEPAQREAFLDQVRAHLPSTKLPKVTMVPGDDEDAKDGVHPL